MRMTTFLDRARLGLLSFLIFLALGAFPTYALADFVGDMLGADQAPAPSSAPVRAVDANQIPAPDSQIVIQNSVAMPADSGPAFGTPVVGVPVVGIPYDSGAIVPPQSTAPQQVVMQPSQTVPFPQKVIYAPIHSGAGPGGNVFDWLAGLFSGPGAQGNHDAPLPGLAQPSVGSHYNW